MSNVIATTADLHVPYEVLGHVSFYIASGYSGFFSAELSLSDLVEKYDEYYKQCVKEGKDNDRMHWAFAYGKLASNGSELTKALYISVEELKRRALALEADAIVGMRQNYDRDVTENHSMYTIHVYGTAVKLVNRP